MDLRERHCCRPTTPSVARLSSNTDSGKGAEWLKAHRLINSEARHKPRVRRRAWLRDTDLARSDLRLAYIADEANEGSLREVRSPLTGLSLECVAESFIYRKLNDFERRIVTPL